MLSRTMKWIINTNVIHINESSAKVWKWHKRKPEPVKLWSHFAPDLRALDLGDEPFVLQLEPVGFVQLGTDQKVKIGNFVILSDLEISQQLTELFKNHRQSPLFIAVKDN